ncbi:MAG TPA: SWIM zinc finger family protein, partial [Ktedonobacteraceae bacterium]|nr:SWIM zinc finger family protein [Ktedonobacteraceae bacterium]
MSKWDRWDNDEDDEDEWDDEDDYDEEDEDEDGYGYWNYYRESQPRRVVGGLKTKSERGAIGETWWSKRWVAVLESFSMGNRLTRGRSYARLGQIVSLDVEPGIVKAKVQGSMLKPYKIEIRLQPLSHRDWEKITEAMASQAIFAAKLLAGEMPKNIEEAFHAVHLSLFPTAGRELVTSCSCPDWANPCKHVA